MKQQLQQYQPEKAILFDVSIRFNKDLSFGEKVFLAEIQSLSERQGYCPFSSRSLSQFFGVSHQTILNWVKKLVELDLVEVGVNYKNKNCPQFLKPKK